MALYQHIVLVFAVAAMCSADDPQSCVDDEYKRKHDDCTVFYHCSNEVWYEKNCSPGLVFSLTSNTCVWRGDKDNDDCQTEVTGDNACPNGELLRNPDECWSYLQCVHGALVRMPCPPGLVFSVVANTCVRQGEYTDDCTTGGNNACIHGELRRNHNDCGKYQHCVHGIPYDMDCATGTVFSIEANICVGLESPWNDCSQGCGGTLTNPAGEIISPNYPEIHDNFVDCEWVITVPSGDHITLTFDTLELEVYISSYYRYGDVSYCPTDFVEIRDGDSSSSPLLGGRRFCGTLVPGPITSSGNNMYIWFHTDFSIRFKGFRATYAIEGACVDGELSPNPGKCESYRQCAHGTQIVQQCGTGTVFSPTLKVCVAAGGYWDDCTQAP